jgi:hypothetical protein
MCYTAALAVQYKDKDFPVRDTCCRIGVPLASAPPYLMKTYTLRLGGWDYDYLIPRGDKSIVFWTGSTSTPIRTFIEKELNSTDVV